MYFFFNFIWVSDYVWHILRMCLVFLIGSPFYFSRYDYHGLSHYMTWCVIILVGLNITEISYNYKSDGRDKTLQCTSTTDSTNSEKSVQTDIEVIRRSG